MKDENTLSIRCKSNSNLNSQIANDNSNEEDRSYNMLIEKLADYAHKAWTGWMQHVFINCCKENDDGSLVIPKWAVDRWTRQMKTPYEELSELEKESDREEAREILTTIKKIKFNENL